MQESGKAAVFLNECADSGNQNCNHTSFKHPCGTGAHIAKQIGWRNHASCNHDNRAADDTDNQYKEHIQSNDAANQYQNIGNGLNQVLFFRNKAAIIAFYGKNKNNDTDGQCVHCVAPFCIFDGIIIQKNGLLFFPFLKLL